MVCPGKCFHALVVHVNGGTTQHVGVSNDLPVSASPGAGFVISAAAAIAEQYDHRFTNICYSHCCCSTARNARAQHDSPFALALVYIPPTARPTATPRIVAPVLIPVRAGDNFR